jgi:TPP-dependent pyruvate/acetoin dehydrogenase alpha subunit
MRRHPAFDPPEYLNWSVTDALLGAYRERLAADPARAQHIAALDEAGRLRLYAGMLRARLHDYALKRWVRQGVISKAWLGTGEEAVTIGSVHALERDRDVVAPMIRNASACHEMGLSIESLFKVYLATADAPTGGRDLHVGDLGRGVLAPISPVGEMVPVITGVALSFQRRGEPRVALTWVGDGSTKTSAVHEGFNLAAVLRVPAVFIIQNNQVALGTRLEQHQRGDFLAWGRMYGMPCEAADGNNVLDVWAATRIAAERARSGGGPTLLVVETFRMGGHATHDEAEARDTFPAELFAYWGQRDPIGLYEAWLEGEGVGRARLEEIEAEVSAEVDAAAEAALGARGSQPTPEEGWQRQPGLAFRLGGLG